ncbi:hypothetical protein TNCT_592411 [Trichonephila clavata]|uniref:C2H2-type domain-containing protein n=1 Tax=Trichonephila clavata TaxID=2740835 RepID=A0A8X6I273_TRICU|nr:hypothetical protein TNCT_592411 [Trichonephila clavata]
MIKGFYAYVYFTGEPPIRTYGCTKCSATFTRRYNLLRHAEKHKEIKELHACNFCNRTFSRKDSLKLHMKSHFDTMQNEEK